MGWVPQAIEAGLTALPQASPRCLTACRVADVDRKLPAPERRGKVPRDTLILPQRDRHGGFVHPQVRSSLVVSC